MFNQTCIVDTRITDNSDVKDKQTETQQSVNSISKYGIHKILRSEYHM